LPEIARLPAASAILLSSLFHVADLNSKTEEGYFVGFPAIWNIVLLYLFALGLAPAAALGVVATCVVLTFVPILAVHPFRVEQLRWLTCLAAAIWAGAAAAAIANPFPSPLWVKALLILTAIYLASVGIARSLVRPGPAR